MVENSNNNKNILLKLIKNVIINKSLQILPLDYLIFEKKLIYN